MSHDRSGRCWARRGRARGKSGRGGGCRWTWKGWLWGTWRSTVSLRMVSSFLLWWDRKGYVKYVAGPRRLETTPANHSELSLSTITQSAQDSTCIALSGKEGDRTSSFSKTASWSALADEGVRIGRWCVGEEKFWVVCRCCFKSSRTSSYLVQLNDGRVWRRHIDLMKRLLKRDLSDISFPVSSEKEAADHSQTHSTPPSSPQPTLSSSPTSSTSTTLTPGSTSSSSTPSTPIVTPPTRRYPLRHRKEPDRFCDTYMYTWKLTREEM